VIATSQINFCENGSSAIILSITHSYWMSIPHSYIVNSLTINTHMPHTIFLELKELEQHKVRGFLLDTPCQVVLTLGAEFPLSPQDLCGTVAGSGVELLVQD
jgi:hypothetical protein